MVFLEPEEERMLAGYEGPAQQKAMELLVNLAETYGAERLVPVESVHLIGGAKTLGLPGIEWLEDLVDSGGRARSGVYVTCNPGSADLESWREMGLEERIVEQQKRLNEAFARFGVIPLRSCLPYLLGNLPRYRTRFSWGGSSGQTFANSVFGAFGNREGGIACVAAAITGRVPAYGIHFPEHRFAQVVVELIDVDPYALGYDDLSAVGYYVGQQIGDKIPVFINLPSGMSVEQIRAFSYSLPVGGAVPMFHIVGVTPEAPTVEEALGHRQPEEHLWVGPSEIKKTKETFRRGQKEEIGLVLFGCPHCTIIEIARIAALLEGKKIHSGTRLWVCTAKQVKVLAERMGYVQTIERAGGLVLVDTCAGPGCPIDFLTTPVGAVVTNSIRSAFYLPGTSKVEAFFGTLEECVQAAISGKRGF